MKSASKTRSANYFIIKIAIATIITIGGATPLPIAFNQLTLPIIQNSNPKKHYSITQQSIIYMYASESERRNEIYNYAFNSSTAINSARKVGKYKLKYNNGMIMSLKVEMRVLSSLPNYA